MYYVIIYIYMYMYAYICTYEHIFMYIHICGALWSELVHSLYPTTFRVSLVHFKHIYLNSCIHEL